MDFDVTLHNITGFKEIHVEAASILRQMQTSYLCEKCVRNCSSKIKFSSNKKKRHDIFTSDALMRYAIENRMTLPFQLIAKKIHHHSSH